MVDGLKHPDEKSQEIDIEQEKVVQSVDALTQDDAVCEEKNSAQPTLSESLQELRPQTDVKMF